MTKTEQARQLLLERYPCQELPAGALTEIAKEVGCSRNLVSQVSLALGMTGTTRKPRPICASCSAEMTLGSKELLCRACKRITVLCDYCEAPIEILASTVVARSSGRYTGLRFCSRPCMSAYRREHSIGRPRDPNLPHGTSGMYRRGCRCEECRGYWRKYYYKARESSNAQ